MKYSLFFILTKIPITFAQVCSSGGSINAACNPNCLSSLPSDKGVNQNEPFYLNAFFL